MDEYQQVMTTLRRSYNQEKAEQRELVEKASVMQSETLPGL